MFAVPGLALPVIKTTISRVRSNTILLRKTTTAGQEANSHNDNPQDSIHVIPATNDFVRQDVNIIDRIFPPSCTDRPH